jgi:glycosyltransferase involved in cell wall biosynthesis
MKILQTVKYYHPSKGGMETVVKNIVEGVSILNQDIKFTVYANQNFPQVKKIECYGAAKVVKEFTPLLYKSQPLNILYSSLNDLIISNDIIHHHYPFPNMEIALLRNINLIKKKQLIITWHANIKNSRWSFIEKIYNPMMKKLLNEAKHVIVTSPQLLENSNILNSYRHKVKIIPLSFDPRCNLNSHPVKTISLDKPRKILFIGKLRAYKGVSYLIDSIRNTDFLLTIVGEGEEEIILRNKVKKMGLDDRITFLKNVDDETITRIYQESDLFVLPSINESEAFGIVQLEAMAHGLPVINTNLNSGVPFVSIDKVSGLTVEPKNSNSLELAINTILNNKKVYETYSINSLERSKLFTREKLAQSYLHLYQS